MTATSVANFATYILVDAIHSAQASYWLHRGQEFVNTMPREGDYVGRLTPAEIDTQAARIQAKADACFARASLCTGIIDESEFIEALDELWARHRAILAAIERKLWSAA